MSTGIISTDAIQDALQRAKELAASSHSNPQKRPNTDDSSNLYPAKRTNAAGNAMDMGGNMQISTLGPGHVGGGGMPPAGGVNDVVVETMEVPDHCVGLVIGRGGEQISQIQSQTSCRVQMSPESDGNSMRQCTLQGSKMSVDCARAMINEILKVITRAGNRPPPNRAGHFDGGMTGGGGRQVTHEILVPGAKCGLVIGKGGETIKSIQVIVPRASVGMIIGKGGETIKRLAAESGAKIQFRPDEDQSTPGRCAVIQGTPEQLLKATQLICVLLRKSGAVEAQNDDKNR